MLKLNNGTTSGGITVGRYFDALNYSSHLSGTYGWGWSDTIMHVLSNGYVLKHGVDPDYFFGTSSYNSPSAGDVECRGLKPSAKDYNALEDAGKYTTSIGTAFNTLFGYKSDTPQRENMVFHTSVDGEVIPRIESLYPYEDKVTRSIWGFDYLIPDNHYAYVYVPWFYTQGFNPPYSYGSGQDFAPYTYSTPLLTESWPILFKKLNRLEYKSSPLSHFDATPFIQTVRLETHTIPVFGESSPYGGSAVGEVRAHGNVISYKYYLWTYSQLRLLDVHMSYRTYDLVPGGATAIGRTIYGVHLDFNITENYYNWDLNGVDVGGYWTRDGDSIHRSFTYTPGGGNFVFSKVSDHFNEIPDLLLENASVSLSGIQRHFMGNFGYFRPSVMHSYSDAMSKYRIMSSNYIEAIVEAGELFDLAPDLVGLIKAFLGLYAGDPVRNSYRIGDFFAESYLKHKFGWEPLRSNAQEISSKINKVGDVLRTIQSPATYHGKYSHQFPDGVRGYDGLSLLTRSKVRVRGASNDFVIKMLGLDRLGLAPRLSNVWDLIPASWMIDYFTSLSKRYEIIDSIFLGMMVGVDFCTHSYTVTGPIPEVVLKNNNLQASGVDPTFSVYGREVSLFVPMILESEYDYAVNPFPPDKGIIASLLWLLLSR